MATETKELEAGRELDALVAEKVMGWTLATIPLAGGVQFWTNGEPRTAGGWFEGFPRKCADQFWSPSTDIAAAWQVVEKLGALGVWKTSYGYSIESYHTGETLAQADTAPLAICRAALAAL